MSTITVEVTAEDIAHGHKGNCQTCPIARALSRMFPGAEVNVGSLYAEVYEPAVSFTDFCLPEIARGFIKSFDVGWPVEPASFELEIMEP